MNTNLIPGYVNSRQAFDAWWRANVFAGTSSYESVSARDERAVAPAAAPMGDRSTQLAADFRSRLVARLSEGLGESIAREVRATAAEWVADPNSPACAAAAEKRAAEKKIPIMVAARELHSEAVHVAARAAVALAFATGRTLNYRDAVTELTRRRSGR